MLQQSLFKDDDNYEQSRNQRYHLGSDLYLEIQYKLKGQAILYRQGCLIKSVNLSDKVAKKMFVIEVVNLGAKQTLYLKHWESAARRFITIEKRTNILVQRG